LDHKIQAESILLLVLRLRGGMLHVSSGRDGSGAILCSGIDSREWAVYEADKRPPREKTAPLPVHAPGLKGCLHCVAPSPEA